MFEPNIEVECLYLPGVNMSIPLNPIQVKKNIFQTNKDDKGILYLV